MKIYNLFRNKLNQELNQLGFNNSKPNSINVNRYISELDKIDENNGCIYHNKVENHFIVVGCYNTGDQYRIGTKLSYIDTKSDYTYSSPHRGNAFPKGYRTKNKAEKAAQKYARDAEIMSSIAKAGLSIQESLLKIEKVQEINKQYPNTWASACNDVAHRIFGNIVTSEQNKDDHNELLDDLNIAKFAYRYDNRAEFQNALQENFVLDAAFIIKNLKSINTFHPRRTNITIPPPPIKQVDKAFINTIEHHDAFNMEYFTDLEKTSAIPANHVITSHGIYAILSERYNLLKRSLSMLEYKKPVSFLSQIACRAKDERALQNIIKYGPPPGLKMMNHLVDKAEKFNLNRHELITVFGL